MGRPARFIPENKNGVLVEVTCRTIGGRALLVPSPDPRRFNEVVVGVMGRALEVSPLELCSALNPNDQEPNHPNGRDRRRAFS